MSRPKVTRSVGATLRPLSPTYRRQIKSTFFSSHGTGPLNDPRRLALESSIFQVQNDLEHRSPRHPQVQAMSSIRGVLLTDAGVCESRPGMTWPEVEAMERILSDGTPEAIQNDDMSSDGSDIVPGHIAA